jgi:hypothetical protein
MDVILSPLKEADKTRDTFQNPPRVARNKQVITQLLPAQEVGQGEDLERRWWRRVFGRAASEADKAEPVRNLPQQFEQYTRTKPPGA